VVLVPVEVPEEPVPPVDPLVPVPVWPELVPPVAAPLLGADGVTAAPLLLPEDEEDDELLGAVEEGVLLEASSSEVVDVLSPEAAAAPPIDVLAGATSACGFLGTTSCVALLPPQAERPTVARSIRVTAVARRRMGGSLLSGLR
jgi:hypothetical protein